MGTWGSTVLQASFAALDTGAPILLAEITSHPHREIVLALAREGTVLVKNSQDILHEEDVLLGGILLFIESTCLAGEQGYR